MKHIAIGQAGGPTAVINATLSGFVRALYKDHSLTFVCNGYEGLANKKFFHADKEIIENLLAHEKVPGAFLGAGRYVFDDKQIYHSVHNLRERGVDTLVFIGGNGTMEALQRIKEEAYRQSYPLQVLGLPKTVDNDLGGTDHAPGFGSAARYVAQATRDIGRDLQAMCNFEQVRILETMGRNSGWLAAASGLLKEDKQDGPHFIALPEKRLNPEWLLQSIEVALQDHGFALIVVSEGVVWEQGSQVEKDKVQGRSVLGGVSKEIEGMIKKNMDVMVRSELLGMNQRSFSGAVSAVDFEEAVKVGETGALWVTQGETDIMVSLQRSQHAAYEITYEPLLLKTIVQNGERSLPQPFLDDQSAYNEWLRPLVGFDLQTYPPPLKRGETTHVQSESK
ncbi:diphosphate--fructose-6-phosphate 1-phosphotransferase [Salibacterium salarium]|uniref:Diphosphate--fructose-6-phosphate 1-phosphotransferase n=1 Tax=Salibacterium salarium TaxID=284579 RepID=A0A3R9P867_9BACI|nr:diphosphate--fructose-6-phosphate 1-phosphotransferase [Salibacterium salarium]RSL33508.1 diphosphate--fructose-6-phosphate 1-phosphotransferase [Salibacterium salarium]